MTDYITNELTATCAALGYYDGHKYHLDRYCLEVIKDLIKYLKRDNEFHKVRRFLGHSKVLQSDLIKIFIEYTDNLELWDVLLRLIINLTSPAIVLFNEQIPTEKTMRNIYNEMITHLQSYKIALTDDRIWSAISKRLKNILDIDPTERDEDSEMTVERILILVRNVLQVPPDENEKRTDNDTTVHDEVLFALHTSGTVDLLSFIASNSNEQQYHLQILEIIFLMLQQRNPAELAVAGSQRSTIEKEKDEAQLLNVRQRESEVKLEKIRKYAGSRHSRFGGTYVVQNMKAIGENQLICHKPFQKIEALDFNQQKTKMKKPKNKRAMLDEKEDRRSVLSVRLFLKEFCVEFLNGAYNPIMRYAKSFVMNGGHDSTTDGYCYLWALRFFMEFNRHYKFQVKYVSETISTEVFHLVQRQMEHYYEMMITDKKKIPFWSRKLHMGLRAYRELLHTLLTMDKSLDFDVRESSKIMKSNVFYVPEYRETLLSQFLNFDEVKMSRKYLMDLVETTHVFLKMLENFCGKGKKNIIVQKIKHKRSKGKNKKKIAKYVSTRSLDERWDDIGPELSAVIRDGIISEVIPFDATSDKPIDEQKEDAMRQIQKFIRQKELEKSIGLFRSSREVWPDSFGEATMPIEDEFIALRDIFFAELGLVEEQQASNAEETVENVLNHDTELNDEEEDEEEEDERQMVVEETDFKFTEFLQRFANVKIVKALTILLRQFEQNTKEVNHYIIKILHRIAWDCKMPGMLFQASIFRIFQKLFESKNPDHKEMQKFAIFIIRRFAEVARKNPKAYMELLFWKSTRDANEVCEGYSLDNENSKKCMRALWTEEEENELRTLFMEHQTNNYTQDLIDWLLDNLINETRTRRGVIKKLKELNLIVNSKAIRSEIQKRLPKEWAEDEVTQLTELWERYKDDDDPVDLIYNELRIKRPRPKIKEKLLETGLASDRKELRKKRRKDNPHKSSWETRSDESDEDRNSDDSERSSSMCSKTSNGVSKQVKQSVKKSVKKRQSRLYTDAELSGLLRNVIDSGMNEALEWVKESLEDSIEDRDEESVEGVPLVPIMESASTAMDSPLFQRLLLAMGIEPPFDEQEAYWRIPANMLTVTIKKRCTVIEDALNGQFASEEVIPEKRDSEVENKNNESSDDEDVLENIKRYFKGKKSSEKEESSEAFKQPIPEIDELQYSQTVREITAVKTKKPAGRRKNLLRSLDSEFEAVELETERENNEIGISKVREIFPRESSDSEIDSENNKVNDEEMKRTRSENSDSDRPIQKKRRLLDSDDENEENIENEDNKLSKKLKFNLSRKLISDDEDSEQST